MGQSRIVHLSTGSDGPVLGFHVAEQLSHLEFLPCKSLPTQGSARGTKKSARRQESAAHGLKDGFGAEVLRHR